MKSIRNLVPAGLKNRLKSSQILNDYFAGEHHIDDFEFKGKSIRDNIKENYDFEGDIVDIFIEECDFSIHKWHHYLSIYEEYFSSWRGGALRFLEIGVSGGGSLSMWRKYFGESAVIFGIDIDERCSKFDGIDAQVRIGSQDDPDFLRRVVAEMGGIDIVLDDGSHVMRHIRTSLDVLFPLLEDKGIYMIEDLHTAYWKDFGGGYTRKANFFNYVNQLVHDMHRWYHVSKVRHPVISDLCDSIHIHDSICVLEKAAIHRPVHSTVLGK